MQLPENLIFGLRLFADIVYDRDAASADRSAMW